VINLINFDLFIQTGYSFNGSIIDIYKLVKLAKDKGYATLGIADHNHLYGAIKFYQACKNAEIKPLIGLHANTKSDIYRDLPLLLYAKSHTGYLNLIQISSYLSTESDYLDLSYLHQHKEDVICIALTASGDIHHLISSGDLAGAHQIVRYLEENVQELYLGLDLNDFETETKIAPELSQLYRTIIANQVMYYDLEDKFASGVLKTLLYEGKNSESGILSNEESNYNFKSLEVLNKIYEEYLPFVQETRKMIENVDFDFDFNQRYLPKYPVPNNYEANQYLQALAKKGLEIRLRSKSGLKKFQEEYNDRLIHELKIIKDMDYADYFLIVWDFVLYAKKNLILVGPGRGSSAGSLVAYALGIVDVDPLEHELFFERFLNPERITMPDIDMDFPDDKRDQVIQYVVEKYGKNHVTSIVAFGTFQGKSALRDVARVLQVKDMIVDEVTKYVGETANSIDVFIKNSPDKYKYLMSIPEVKVLFDVARKLVDLPKHISTHAAGIVISNEEITKHVPVQTGLVNMFQTQFEATDLEQIGLLKIDFLGIRNLTIIQKVADLIERNTAKKIDIYKLPLDDKNTYQLLCDVRTLGIFQLESRGMMNLLRQMQIRSFEDISTCIALFRPGPMENIPSYLRRINKQEPITYLHPILEPILSSTKGIIVYQEQIMQIAHIFAGYSLGEADVLRRAVSKKKESVLLEERERFIRKCNEMNHPENISNQIYDYIVKFANYGFNKSHSVAYSVVAYWMAYLKANYPGYFMAVLMDSAIGSQTATANYIQECRSLGIQILPPRINKSGKAYHMEGQALRFPYLGIRNIGNIVADKLEQIQNGQDFTSFVDFVCRAKDINSRVIESMVLVGMFDDLGETKQTMVENLRQITLSLNLGQNLDEIGFVYVKYPEYDMKFLVEQEKELIGFNLSFHPLSKIKATLENKGIRLLSEVELTKHKDIIFAGMLKRKKKIKTKKQDDMAFLEFEDMFQTLEAVIFPQEYHRFGNDLTVGELYVVEGTVDSRNNQLQVIIKRMEIVKEDKK